MRTLYREAGWAWRFWDFGVFFYAFLLKPTPHAQILTSITAEFCFQNLVSDSLHTISKSRDHLQEFFYYSDMLLSSYYLWCRMMTSQDAASCITSTDHSLEILYNCNREILKGGWIIDHNFTCSFPRLILKLDPSSQTPDALAVHNSHANQPS